MNTLKSISDEKMSFSFHINGTCYCFTEDDKKYRVLYEDERKDMFYKKNGKKIYLNKEQTEKFNKTQS